jgi:hypothetical protein
MAISRRGLLRSLALAAVLSVITVSQVLAHHGWRWAEDGEFVIRGYFVSAQLGNPHGLVTLDVNGEEWTIEVGQPWRNERAGLTDDMFAKGADMTARGHRSKDAIDRRVKAERIIFDGKTDDLYPDRQ